MKQLALKYRPKSFSSLVGQATVSSSLKNAIEFNHIIHCYLFYGPRGIGKTSTARIFAKSLNCTEGLSVESCGKCSSCIDISKGQDLDVIEMDAASNRGIEHIRELKNNVMFPPMKSRYKIYIIDEVHMLTNESFNALLKTLEEPPSHAIFILATTEKHKIPETILSRCQVYFFKKFTFAEIISNLEAILKLEKIQYDLESLQLIAQKAEGSMRDALSLLDQSLSFVGTEPLKAELVQKILGIINFSFFLNMLEALRTKNLKASLQVIEEIFREGYNLKHFLLEFLNFIKLASLIHLDMLSESSEEHLTQEQFESMKQYVSKWDSFELHKVFDIIYEIYSKQSIFETTKEYEIRISIENALFKVIETLKQPSISKLMSQLETIKQEILNSDNHIITNSPEKDFTKDQETKVPDSPDFTKGNINQEKKPLDDGNKDLKEVFHKTFLGTPEKDIKKDIFKTED